MSELLTIAVNGLDWPFAKNKACRNPDQVKRQLLVSAHHQSHRFACENTESQPSNSPAECGIYSERIRFLSQFEEQGQA